MEPYIKKADIVAEIEKRLSLLENGISDSEVMKRVEGVIKGYKSILSFLDTLEMKEVDLENSMVCKVGWYDGLFLDYTQEQQNALLEKIGATCGEKIRVILIKE